MNKLGPKTHVAEVVDLSKFDSPSIQILLTANTKFLFHSMSTKLSHIASILPLSLRGFLNKVTSQHKQAFFQLSVSHSLCILLCILYVFLNFLEVFQTPSCGCSQDASQLTNFSFLPDTSNTALSTTACLNQIFESNSIVSQAAFDLKKSASNLTFRLHQGRDFLQCS